MPMPDTSREAIFLLALLEQGLWPADDCNRELGSEEVNGSVTNHCVME